MSFHPFQFVCRAALGAPALVALALTACGSGDAEPTLDHDASDVGAISEVGQLGLFLESDDSTALPLDLSGDWPDWSGAPTGITWDDASATLSIPGSGTRDIVLGVRRFDIPLDAGRTYRLSIASADAPGSAVLVFPFDADGRPVAALAEDAELAVAQPGAPLAFVAPVGVTGFYLQVQNAWRATGAATIQPGLHPEAIDDASLLTPSAPWYAWSGAPAAGIVWANRGNALVIYAPDDGTSLRIGIQRYARGLDAGQTYELVATGTRGAKALLFLYDAEGQLIGDGSANGLAAEASLAFTTVTDTTRYRGVTRFVAPEGVTTFVVQVQGAYGEAGVANILPRLAATTEPVIATDFAQLQPSPTVAVPSGSGPVTTMLCRDRTATSLGAAEFAVGPDGVLRDGAAASVSALLTADASTRQTDLGFGVTRADGQSLRDDGEHYVVVERLTQNGQSLVTYYESGVTGRSMIRCGTSTMTGYRYLSCVDPIRGAPTAYQPAPTRHLAHAIANPLDGTAQLVIDGWAGADAVHDPDTGRTVTPLSDDWTRYVQEGIPGVRASQTWEYLRSTGDVRLFRSSEGATDPGNSCETWWEPTPVRPQTQRDENIGGTDLSAS